MKVLITTSTFPITENDGTPRFVFDLAKALSKMCDVTVLAPHSHGALRQENIGALKILRFQYSWPASTQKLAYGYGMRQNISTSWAAKAQIPIYIASMSIAVAKLIKRHRFDVINSHWVIPQGLAVSLCLGGHPSIAHAVTAHSGDVALIKKWNLAKPWARWISKRTHMFLPVSKHIAHDLKPYVGHKPWTVQPMGVDDHLFSRSLKPDSTMPFDGKFILFIGRLVEKKGITCLLEAMNLLKDRQYDINLVVVGDGIMQDALEKKCKKLGLQNRVRFMGRMNHNEFYPLLHGCKVFALPSIIDPKGETEGMPTVLAEAMSAGCKVVASRVGGITDILKDGKNGWLAQPDNSSDLADKLAVALKHNTGEIQKHARQTARALDWSKVAEQYLACFRNAISECKAGNK